MAVPRDSNGLAAGVRDWLGVLGALVPARSGGLAPTLELATSRLRLELIADQIPGQHRHVAGDLTVFCS